MDLPRDSEFPPDLSPLAWVQEELRRSLESVHKTLRRFLREADGRASVLGIDAPASPPLLAAAAQLHQVAGVLVLVGLPGGAAVLRAAETAVQNLAQQPLNIDLPTVEIIERADFALLSFVARLLAGNKTSSLALFPPYRELQTLNGAERIHPADLWPQEFAWRDLPVDPVAKPLAPEAVRRAFEATLLKQMRSPRPEHASLLSDLCAGLAAGLAGAQARTLWQLAAAQYQAQALGLLNPDTYAKRLGSRLLSQLRAGGAAASQRLAHDLLFFCAQARPEPAAVRLMAVREVYGLGDESAGDYEDDSLGRIDPAWVAQARRRVSQAKESWSSAAEGETHRLAGLDEQFAGLNESLSRLFPSGEVLGETLQRAVVATLRSNQPPKPDLAMEVATGLLYVEAALDDAAFDQPEQAERVRRLAQRVEAVSHGEPPAPLEAWMEDLYRRVSDRQTLGSVVHELRASLSEVERLADEYFRNPSQRQVLIPVPGQLQTMRGVLTVLGLDQAAQATVRMRDEVDALANTEVDPELAGPRELFERLANNLGALGFMIDMLSVQPQLAKRMFHFDEASGRLDAVMGRRSDAVSLPPLDGAAEPSLLSQVQAAAQAAADGERPAEELARDLERLSQQARAADEPGLAHAAQSAQRLLDEALPTLPLPLDPSAQDLAPVADEELDTALAQAAQSLNQFLEAHAPAAAPVAAPVSASLQLDEDMLPIFLEEAEEVIANAREALALLEQDHHNLEQLTTVRRAFHTLKGSSRMVGLNAFGEGAWACEQLYNTRIGEQTGADPALLAFTAEALDYLADWCEAITSRRPGPHQPDGLRNSADALRLEGRVLPLDWPSSGAVPLSSEPEPLSQAVVEPALPPSVEPESELEAEALPEQETLPVPEVSADDAGFVLDLLPPTESSADAAPELELPEFELPEFELRLDLGEPEPEVEPPLHSAAAPLLELVPPVEPEPIEEIEAEDSVKVIGPLRISITLFNIFLNEADELSRRLSTILAEWALELAVPVPADAEALAHALAGNAATVGFEDLSALARALEHALGRAAQAGSYEVQDAELFVGAADDLRRLLHQFAAGFLKTVEGDLLPRLHDYQPAPVLPVESEPMDLEMPEPALQDFAVRAELAAKDEAGFVGGQPDDIDTELFPIFEEEAQDLLEQLHASLRDWLASPQSRARADACMRSLHTFKGGARLSGAMGLGEQAHKLESSVESLLGRPELDGGDLRELQSQADALEASFEQLRHRLKQGPAEAQAKEPAPVPVPVPPVEPVDVVPVAAMPEDSALVAEEPLALDAGPQIDWSRFGRGVQAAAEEATAVSAQPLVRVRGALLERMATQAGEVSIRRARLESELAQMKSALLDLDDNLDRLRSQLRELEVQAEGQMGSQQEAAKLAGRDFDPLEFDRYTRFQELTRMLAESVNDVATVQRSLQRNVQLGEDELAGQSRLTRELQDDLLRTRMVEFDSSLAERLHRVVRQAARESGKQATLTIVGGHIELDRSMLERLTGAFEHLLRNSLSHGIETPEARVAAGKPESGTITLRLAQEGNEVLLAFSDDGAGLNLARIRERGEMLGLVSQGAELEDSALMELIFAPGFSTASQVTELAGRGVGMDVVRAEVSTLGGYVDIHSTPGQGAGFDLHVPLTTALTQVVLLRYGEHKVAVPAALMESVQRLPLDTVEQAYADASLQQGDTALPFYWLGGLMNHSGRGVLLGRTLPVVFIKSAHQRMALHVDEVLGNQEVVIKNLGPQLSGVPGLAGISLLASGDVALIYNPVALAHWYGAAAQSHAQQAAVSAASPLDAPEVLAPLVLVVDDSLTVRRVTQRLLEREGYRVQLAKDGMDAMEKLSGDELPAVVLSDIEMPRMDGFDLVRNMRADARLAGLPVIMITSRIAQKHKDYAQELGVDHYLGKPYDEELLLDLIGRYTSSQIAVTQ
ncbi:Hpt domain-containing protein [Paucibacter sp. PLA-PC-4]|uniref:hybrid sensor histidine kinase/response regulator n=1 Tax=Paucibacter sp. PLA-PC-4 TaxID=2993655 RepID=UPI0022494191|nr:Hpt domain-containing protein [Paucibacter sp. PLA-PC-4]MCX2861254.1 Hpt domain-containing protein [Paucibacter sp. PLA-PC-4]